MESIVESVVNGTKCRFVLDRSNLYLQYCMGQQGAFGAASPQWCNEPGRSGLSLPNNTEMLKVLVSMLEKCVVYIENHARL